MYEKELTKAGLTTNEAKVYLALLQIGQSSTGTIIQEAKIASGKIYETLNKLIDKGLVDFITEGGVKKFSATNPNSLLIYMDERKNKLDQETKNLEKILPNLKKIRKFTQTEEGVSLIKGFKGIRPIVNEALKLKGEAKIMGVRSSKDKAFNIFWQQWHQLRVKKKKKARVLFSDRKTKYWDFFKKLSLTTVRTMTQISPSAIMVIGDEAFIFNYEREFTCIHIRSPTIAQSFDSFFEQLWSIGKK